MVNSNLVVGNIFAIDFLLSLFYVIQIILKMFLCDLNMKVHSWKIEEGKKRGLWNLFFVDISNTTKQLKKN